MVAQFPKCVYVLLSCHLFVVSSLFVLSTRVYTIAHADMQPKCARAPFGLREVTLGTQPRSSQEEFRELGSLKFAPCCLRATVAKHWDRQADSQSGLTLFKRMTEKEIQERVSFAFSMLPAFSAYRTVDSQPTDLQPATK